MPFDEYTWIERREILTYEEITRLAGIFVQCGVEKIRLTGGEPLVRRGLDRLIQMLSALDGLNDLSLTTNGALLAEQAEGLRAAGLRRINVSLDTLRPDRFKEITKRGDLNDVLEALSAAQRCGFHPIKINAVIIRGVNDDEIVELVEFSRTHGFAMRFIEYMDVGNANGWNLDKMVPKKEIIEIIQARVPLKEAGRDNASDTAVRYECADGTGDIGVIASVTEPFCSNCTRARLTADGKLVTCLFSDVGHDLKSPMRAGASDEELKKVIATVWGRRTDRYSDERLEAITSGVGYQAGERRKIEMISLGG
jgi:cyclic pyranopterin phosphate synthase